MPTLRREVEVPRRPYERASIYLGIGSLLVSLLIVLDAARWSSHAARAAEVRQDAARHVRAAAARLRAVRCHATRKAGARAAAARRARAAHQAEARAEHEAAIIGADLAREHQRNPGPARSARVDLDRAAVHDQLMRELERAPAVLDDVDPIARYGIGRYGKMNHVEPDAGQRYQKAIERSRPAIGGAAPKVVNGTLHAPRTPSR